MNFCFGQYYDLPFDTFFPIAPKQNLGANWIQNTIQIIQRKLNFEPSLLPMFHCIHRIEDFPGGPLLEIYKFQDLIFIRYAELVAKLEKNKISIEGDIESKARITQILERVIFPLHLFFHSTPTNPKARLIPLHGSAIAIENNAFIFIGKSGNGKSTTVLELLKRGASILADDLVWIDIQNFSVLPGLSSIRLLKPIEDSSSLTFLACEKIGTDIEKWWHILEDPKKNKTFPLKEIFILNSFNQNFSIEPTRGYQKISRLLEQSFSLESSYQEKERFSAISGLAKNINISNLSFKKGEKGPIHIDQLWDTLQEKSR